MRAPAISRRLALAAVVASPTLLEARSDRLRLGGPVFIKSKDPEVLARAHQEYGYRAAYAPEIPAADHDYCRAVIEAYANHDVVIAEVGAWVNMLDPDSAIRRRNMEYVETRLHLAEELGARCCVDIAGSFNAKVWYGPDPRNLSQEYIDRSVENVRKLIDAVRPRRTRFSIEMSPWNFPTSPDEYLRLIRAVDRTAFAVHVDICNLINSPYRMYDNAAVIREVYTKLGKWIASNHIKDLRWVTAKALAFEETVPGRGNIDYKTWLSSLSRYAADSPLMLEHLQSEQEYDEGRNHLHRTATELGLSF
jgi:sugar phosphate isomerase/epimerase